MDKHHLEEKRYIFVAGGRERGDYQSNIDSYILTPSGKRVYHENIKKDYRILLGEI